ncbi:MAG: chemotaxis protein CheW, partial [Cyanobacteria bacterium P01_H01_bin.15]
MDNSPYLVFELEELNYAVEATLVQEIFPLPALMPIADAPRDVVGILNYRGKVLPVIHLAKRLGQGNPTCKLQDNVIVINGLDCQIGLVVETVKDVRIIPESNFEPGPNYGRINEINTAFISRIAKLEDQVLAVVLNV